MERDEAHARLADVDVDLACEGEAAGVYLRVALGELRFERREGGREGAHDEAGDWEHDRDAVLRQREAGFSHHVTLCAQLFANSGGRERARNEPLELLCRGEERRRRSFERDDLGQGRRLARESRVERPERVDEVPVAVVEAEGEVRVDDREDL